jgi:hypothetical protein
MHSIIAVLGEGPISGKTDGVVAYESAHIEGVESAKSCASATRRKVIRKRARKCG